MPKQIIIDGTLIEVDERTTLLQACEQAGAEIPRFCYHDRLSIAGNCRMCLVEVGGVAKPIASCGCPIESWLQLSKSKVLYSSSTALAIPR